VTGRRTPVAVADTNLNLPDTNAYGTSANSLLPSKIIFLIFIRKNIDHVDFIEPVLN